MFLSTSIAENTLLSELVDRYLTEVAPSKKSEADIKVRGKLLKGKLGDHVLAAITPLTVKEFRDMRLETVKGDTVRKEISLLSRILKLAQQEWDIYLPRGNPVDSVGLPPKGKGRDRRLQLGEEERLLKEAKEYGGYIEDIIHLALETGARRGELVNLQWANIKMLKRTAILSGTKNGDDREIPLFSKAVAVIERQPHPITGFLFPIRGDSVTQAFTRVCKNAKIKGLRFHDLRHEAISRFFELGLETMEVSAITGHKDLAMLKRYTHLKAEDLAKKLG
ncbi:MAG: site-specific integrase [Gammaproteobacteria bacterium]|nr:site-specific integrase [Gammaproteobacteria bacterium]